MTERMNKADKMVFKALQKAINSDKLHLCLLSSKLNVPTSPVYNPWEVLLPSLIPVVLGLILIWAMGVLWGLAFMIGGILLSNNLVKKKLEQRLFERTKAMFISDYQHCNELWDFGGIVLVNSADKSQGCVSPEGNWKEFVILHYADLMIDNSANDKTADEAKKEGGKDEKAA